MAGFGGGGSSKKGAKKGTVKALKPKSQWDKYKSFKQEATRIRAAARVVASAGDDDSDAGEWYEVGQIKSEGDEFTELAVVMQRGIIAEHAKRLHPLQFLPKDLMEWAYETNDEWVAVDKNIASTAPAGIEKKIGFQGLPDNTGFCSRVSGKQFVGETSTAPLAVGSNTGHRSVLPRVK